MTKAIILAAGQGSRLRPLTDNMPKCMVKLNNISILERQISTLSSQGIHDICIITGYKEEKIRALGYKTCINHDYLSTNMVSSLFCAKDFFESLKEDLVISYGDIVFEKENLQILLRNTSPIACMIDRGWKQLWSLRNENPLDDAETLVVDSDDNIIEIGKKPKNFEKIDGQYTGLIKINKNYVKKLIDFYYSLDKKSIYDGQNFKNMYMTSFLQELINNNWTIKASYVQNGWLEVDSVSDLKIYENLFSAGELDKICKI